MKTDRLIARVKAMLEREQNTARLAQLTSLLITLQNEYILELQKLNIKRKVA